MPELIVSVPAEWTGAQVAAYQAFFDLLMTDNPDQKSKVRFMPGGMKPFDIKNANGDALKADIDEWLARIVCFAYSVNPQPFIRMVRAQSQSLGEQAEEEGRFPTLAWFKTEIMDPIIQDPDIGFGCADLEFSWLPNPEVDQNIQSQIIDRDVKNGTMLVDEAREMRGQEPYGPGVGDVPMIYLPTGPVRLADAASGALSAAMMAPDEGGDDDAPPRPAPKQKPEVGKSAAATFRKGETTRPGSASAQHDAKCYCNDCLVVGAGAYAAALARRRGIAEASV
jgi:hypothetical protein